MSLVLAPKVRYMLVCDEVLQDERWPGKPVVVGLTSLVLRGEGEEAAELEKLCVYLVLTGGRGVGGARIRCIDEASEKTVFRTREVDLSFVGKDPSGLHSAVFRMEGCRFPGPGVYLLQFLSDGVVVEERPVMVR